MQCQEIVIELDAYLTGELDADAGAGIGRHLEECASCRAALELLRKENAIYQQYVSAIEIPGVVANSLAVPGGKPNSAVHWWRWAAAAAVLMAAVVSWRFYAERQDDGTGGDVAGGQMPEISMPAHQAMTIYEQAVSLLQTLYEAKKPNLDPALVRELERSLEITEKAVAECKLALKKDPNNPQALEFLLLDYEKQVGMLRQITEAL
jgi:predicted anti-sigma-YlaC factor YlaD